MPQPPWSISRTKVQCKDDDDHDDDDEENGTVDGASAETSRSHRPQSEAPAAPGAVLQGGLRVSDEGYDSSKKEADSITEPNFKDQMRPAGFEAGEEAASQAGDNSIPLAQSVHIVVDEDPETDPAIMTQPAAVLQTYPAGINAKNTVGSYPEGAANRSGSQRSNINNNSHVSSSTSPPVQPEDALNSQEIVLCKHLIWAGAAVLITVAVVVAVVIMAGSDGSSSAAVSMELPTSIPRSNAPAPPTEPSIKVTSAPTMVATTEAPADEELLLTIEPTPTLTTKIPSAAPSKRPAALEPSTNLPTTIPPSILAPTIASEIKLLASDGLDGNWFGISVAIGGNTIVIGASTNATKNGIASGSAYVYTRSGTDWTEQAKLTASDGAAADSFGISVAVNVDADTIVIGADGDDTDKGIASGSAYVYTRSGTVWTEQVKLTASDGATGDKFGRSVAIIGDTIVIGVQRDNTESGASSGSAYVYTRSGTVWTEQAKLTASDGVAYDRFGKSVAIDGDTIVIGAHLDDTDSGSDSGSAYVYIRSGTVWTEQAKLTASDGARDDLFGYNVAISGDTIVIGAYGDDDNGEYRGSVYVYTLSGIIWTEQAKLTASDGGKDDYFGKSVAIDGDTIAIGADWGGTESGESSGSAYVYTRSGSAWTELFKLAASDGATFDYFGTSVAVDGDTIVIGAPADDNENGIDSGSVYNYVIY